ncbi:uncharacterized protein LOC111085811 isoform X2 [Limulus polyphemus]|uniref:Uncharacterized protein LOC111085811 isoform X2 n=1 Tax=Limulus polyphemus TaxID=6850 RepID=A0ABM1SDW8_LIMPO|nr:uncharacterized protein LOC111085811 isoform X2 [Limulus polyphemus]XP_022241822.1 uncharacterized protein LOC111085811 isoform X2 [Limulus polyphemus]XP_022241823.1 uncharacterized protein LOC111085811 isoform X2 [Limulus polyphemus]
MLESLQKWSINQGCLRLSGVQGLPGPHGLIGRKDLMVQKVHMEKVGKKELWVQKALEVVGLWNGLPSDVVEVVNLETKMANAVHQENMIKKVSQD